MGPGAMEIIVTDLTAFAPADTSVLSIIAPSGSDTGWKITFAGPGHPKTVAWADESARKSIRQQQRIEAARVNGRKFKPDDREVDEVRRENVEWVAARIVDWTTIEIDGKNIAFTTEAAIGIFLDPRFSWVLVQCFDFLGDEASFTKGSPKP